MLKMLKSRHPNLMCLNQNYKTFQMEIRIRRLLPATSRIMDKFTSSVHTLGMAFKNVESAFAEFFKTHSKITNKDYHE
jgi:hypothetical protein